MNLDGRPSPQPSPRIAGRGCSEDGRGERFMGSENLRISDASFDHEPPDGRSLTRPPGTLSAFASRQSAASARRRPIGWERDGVRVSSWRAGTICESRIGTMNPDGHPSPQPSPRWRGAREKSTRPPEDRGGASSLAPRRRSGERARERVSSWRGRGVRPGNEGLCAVSAVPGFAERNSAEGRIPRRAAFCRMPIESRPRRSSSQRRAQK